MRFCALRDSRVGKWVIFLVCLMLTVAWMAAIFGFSANDAKESTVQSHAVTEIIIRIFNRSFDDMSEAEQEALISRYDGIVRKIAHFVAYAALGFLVYLSIMSSPFLSFINKQRAAAFSFPLCVIFAVTDEYHQTFVDGRAGQLSDILVDSGGILFGVLFAVLITVLLERLSQRK